MALIPFAVSAVLLLLLGSQPALAYDYKKDGLDWAGLCQSGEYQSPIHIVRDRAVWTSLPITLSYDVSKNFSITNNGNNVLIKPQPGTTNIITIGSQIYNLVQVHAHAFSEHAFDGYFTPLEVHFVHANAANSSQLAVIGTLLRLSNDGNNNTFIDKWVTQPVPAAGTTVVINDSIDFSSLLSKRIQVNRVWQRASKTIYTYPGSLTTPSCSQGVTWLVIEPDQGAKISVSQLEQFQLLVEGLDDTLTDNRPPQPLGSRTVQYFKTNL